MGVPFDVNETCGKVTGGFATGWERGTESEANAPEDGRILNRVYENKYFGFDCRRVGASRTEGFVALQLRKREQTVRQAK